MTALSRKDKTRFVEILERIEDERARYFLMMFCDALTNYAVGRKSRAHRANTSPAHISKIEARLNG